MNKGELPTPDTPNQPEEQPAAVARKRNPLEHGNNDAAKRLDEVRRVSQPIGNYAVGGKKFNVINF